MTQRIIYLDAPTDKALPNASALHIAANDAQVHIVSDEQAALAAIKALPAITAFVSNTAKSSLFKLLRELQPQAASILVTNQPMHIYSAQLDGHEHQLLDHLLAQRSNGNWLINELRVTLQKLLRKDIFGPEKYLAAGTKIHATRVASSADREALNTTVMRFAEKNQIGQSTSKMIFGIVEEMLMNAIYDAPVAAGAERFKTIARTSLINLEPSEQPTLSYAYDGDTFAIGVRDPFGALRQDKIFEYLKKVLKRSDSTQLIDTKAGGAGLGLFKIFYCSHALVCNVEPGKATEVIALIDSADQLRDFAKMPRSIHYFRV